MHFLGILRRTSRFLIAVCVIASLPGIATAQSPLLALAHSLPNVAPSDIVVGPDANLWFIETGAIGRVTPTGVITSYLLPHHSADHPSGLTVGPDGAMWFLLPDTIGRITMSGSVNTAKLSTLMGGHIGDPKSVRNLVVGPDRQLWYLTESRDASRYLMEISHLPVTSNTTSPRGINLQRTLESDFVTTDKAIDPRLLVTGSDGTTLFIEFQDNPAFPLDIRIGQIASGNKVRLFPISLKALFGYHYTMQPEKACEQGICLPEDLTQTTNGAIWFTMLVPVLGHIAKSGKVSGVAEKPVPGRRFGACQQGIPASITHDGQGNVWYGELTFACINRLTPKGVDSTLVSPHRLDNIDGLAADGQGNMWFTLECVNSVGRLAPSGQIALYHIPHTAADAGPECPVTL